MELNNCRSIDEVPSLYRNIFSEYPFFNVVQSTVLDEVLHTDNSLVVSAPTGSGKTVIFELSIVRFLLEHPDDVSPIKALCEERLIDWQSKFSPYNLNCIAVNGDSENIEFYNLRNFNIIIATPEKWDVLTRTWRSNKNFVQSIKLFMIDEVHLLNTDIRGSTLEVTVCRMKTINQSLNQMSVEMPQKIRFIAVSASIPNVEDIADWIGPSLTTKHFHFTEEMRPVKLNKIVLGYPYNPNTNTAFKFDIYLNYKLQNLMLQYSQGKPILIFCSTRKSVEMTANFIVQNIRINLNSEQRQLLNEMSMQINDEKIKQFILHGVAFHHAGLVPDIRHKIEVFFRQGNLPILVTTSTLAMGVNLPAHLVIIKSTKIYDRMGLKDYSETEIYQMIGRAGRPQFDTSATAVIMTTQQDKGKFVNMLGSGVRIESNLHRHFTEHLNAEVVLGTINNLDIAMQWLTSTFLYIRAQKNPAYYNLPSGLSADEIDKKLLDMCNIDLNKLQTGDMLTMNEDIEIFPTVKGKIMAKYYVTFETMKLFSKMTGKEILLQILEIISKSQEFSDIKLRVNDKRILNLYNRNSQKETIRFPIKGKIKTVEMKINCLIQAVLGNLEMIDHSILNDSHKIMRQCSRIAKCLIEYLQTLSDCYTALLNATILYKCFEAKLWENSHFVSKQLTGIGHVMSQQLVKAGKTSFQLIAETNPRQIEIIIKRKAPLGNVILDEIKHLPSYEINLKLTPGRKLMLVIRLNNVSILEEKCTIKNIHSLMILFVGNENNKMLLYEQYSHSYIMENPVIEKIIDIEDDYKGKIYADFISDNWVGIDCKTNILIENPAPPKSLLVKKSTEKENGKTYMQTFLDVYLGCNANNENCEKMGLSNDKENAILNKKPQATPKKITKPKVNATSKKLQKPNKIIVSNNIYGKVVKRKFDENKIKLKQIFEKSQEPNINPKGINKANSQNGLEHNHNKEECLHSDNGICESFADFLKSNNYTEFDTSSNTNVKDSKIIKDDSTESCNNSQISEILKGKNDIFAENSGNKSKSNIKCSVEPILQQNISSFKNLDSQEKGKIIPSISVIKCEEPVEKTSQDFLKTKQIQDDERIIKKCKNPKYYTIENKYKKLSPTTSVVSQYKKTQIPIDIVQENYENKTDMFSENSQNESKDPSVSQFPDDNIFHNFKKPNCLENNNTETALTSLTPDKVSGNNSLQKSRFTMKDSDYLGEKEIFSLSVKYKSDSPILQSHRKMFNKSLSEFDGLLLESATKPVTEYKMHRNKECIPDSTVKKSSFVNEFSKKNVKFTHEVAENSIQKNISWRSPLIQSPGVRFSPNVMLNDEFRNEFDCNEERGNNETLGSSTASNSSVVSLNINFQNAPKLKQMPSPWRSAKKIRQLPLCDSAYEEQEKKTISRKPTFDNTSAKLLSFFDIDNASPKASSSITTVENAAKNSKSATDYYSKIMSQIPTSQTKRDVNDQNQKNTQQRSTLNFISASQTDCSGQRNNSVYFNGNTFSENQTSRTVNSNIHEDFNEEGLFYSQNPRFENVAPYNNTTRVTRPHSQLPLTQMQQLNPRAYKIIPKPIRYEFNPYNTSRLMHGNINNSFSQNYKENLPSSEELDKYLHDFDQTDIDPGSNRFINQCVPFGNSLSASYRNPIFRESPLNRSMFIEVPLDNTFIPSTPGISYSSVPGYLPLVDSQLPVPQYGYYNPVQHNNPTISASQYMMYPSNQQLHRQRKPFNNNNVEYPERFMQVKPANSDQLNLTHCSFNSDNRRFVNSANGAVNSNFNTDVHSIQSDQQINQNCAFETVRNHTANVSRSLLSDKSYQTKKKPTLHDDTFDDRLNEMTSNSNDTRDKIIMAQPNKVSRNQLSFSQADRAPQQNCSESRDLSFVHQQPQPFMPQTSQFGTDFNYTGRFIAKPYFNGDY